MKYMTDEQFSKEMEKIKEKNHQFELKNKLKKEKKKMKKFIFPKFKTSNVVLVTAIMAVLLFSIVCLYIQYTTSIEVSSTLITLWYSFWTVEIVSLAGIKVSKVFKNSNSEIEDLDFDVDLELEDSNDTVG